jgi:hypothetical protein
VDIWRWIILRIGGKDPRGGMANVYEIEDMERRRDS